MKSYFVKSIYDIYQVVLFTSRSTNMCAYLLKYSNVFCSTLHIGLLRINSNALHFCGNMQILILLHWD